jgi:hypothetical protein
MKKKVVFYLSSLLPTGFIPFSLVFSVGKDILFCNIWRSVGCSELQMCMTFSVGFLKTAFFLMY